MRWRWITPGAVIGILGWLVASTGSSPLYLHFFNTCSFAYGSLGSRRSSLLMWFYITGLMLLLGAEINSQIGAAAAGQSARMGSRFLPYSPQASAASAGM